MAGPAPGGGGLFPTMATIRASCPDCGDVEFTTGDIEVRVSATDGSGSYSFCCPLCRITVVKSAEARTIDLLVASGVALTTDPVVAELEEPRDGDPITHDDLLDFHDLLHRDDSWLEALSIEADRER